MNREEALKRDENLPEVQIINIINELNESNSSNYKLEVLEKYKEHEVFKQVLLYTYNPRWQYYVKKIPEKSPDRYCIDNNSIQDLFNLLDSLKQRTLTGNNALEAIKGFRHNSSLELDKILCLILDRDLRCNISTKSINKVFPKLIPTTPYMRCSKLDEKTEKNIKQEDIMLLQKKSDGVFSYIIKQGTEVKLLTRAGSEWKSQTLEDSLSYLCYDFVAVGEALIKEGERELDRKTGNGMINSLIKREQTLQSLEEKVANAKTPKQQTSAISKLQNKEEELNLIDSKLYFECWDYLSIAEFEAEYSEMPYKIRFSKLLCDVVDKSDRVQGIPSQRVKSIEEARILGQEYIKQGFEGAILKSGKMPFENKTSKLQVKIKAELDADLLCVGYEEGTGKYEGMIGALYLESSCGMLKVKVGTGFTDADRCKDPEEYVGKIIEVKYNELVDSKGKDTYSLFLPVFVEVREKTEADSLADIML